MTNETIQWTPAYMGKRMEDWRNLGDWNISRRRFYGLPLPFWMLVRASAVIGSKDELAAKALHALHRAARGAASSLD